MAAYDIPRSNSSKPHIIINTGTANYSTSIGLVGPNYKGYGEVIAKNFLYILENFANSIPPANPSEGQLWYDTSNPSSKVLRIFDQARWIPINGIWQQSAEPTYVKTGDLWIDTGSKQLRIYSGINWVTVGADFSQGFQTGNENTSLLGTDGIYHSVIVSYLNGDAITILSKESFKPIEVIDGFDNLIPGLNISNKPYDNLVPKIYGNASEASALSVTAPNAQTVSANNFLRKDIPQSLTESLVIDNNAGLRIGATSSTFLLQKVGSDARISSISPGSKILFSITSETGVPKSLVTIDGSGDNGRIGIGANNVNPVATLDVSGTLRVSNSATMASSLLVLKEFIAASTATITGPANFSNVSRFNGTMLSQAIVPLSTSTYDIGTQSIPFNNIYAGVVNAGYFSGNAETAKYLFTPTTFSASNGQVDLLPSSNFDGATNINFTATVTHKSIDQQPSTSTVSGSYSIAVSNNTDKLYKITKTDFLSDVSPGLSSSGMIMSWAGDVAPTGWALCDGATYNQSGLYNSLFSVIGIKYGSTAPGTFQVPNLTSLTATGPVTIKYIIRI